MRHLHVALAARDDVDGRLREVPAHDAAVVGDRLGTEIGVRERMSYARRITDSRKPCGVWPRRSRARGGMAVMTSASSTTITVSAEGIATSTAS